MRKQIIFSTFLILLIINMFRFINSAPAIQEPQNFTQPNGNSFIAQGFGDECTHWVETLEGYTIIRISYDDYWTYALKENGELIPSDYIVTIANPNELNLTKHLTPDENKNCNFVGTEGNPNLVVDPLVIEKLQNQTEVYVTVRLIDDSNIIYGTPRQIYEQKAEYFKQAEEGVISTLNKSEFRLDYRYTIINAFGGYITRDGLEKLTMNPKVLVIETDREVSVGNQDENKEIELNKNLWLIIIPLSIVLLIIIGYILFKKKRK